MFCALLASRSSVCHLNRSCCGAAALQENLARAAQEQGLPAHINYAHSNNPNNTATVLAVGPAVSNAVDSITGRLRVIGSREEPGQDVQPAPEVQ
jgi:hypothetical protein